MAHASVRQLIFARYIYLSQLDAGPRSPRENFGFKSVTHETTIYFFYFLKRINAEAALAVGNNRAAFAAQKQIADRSSDAAGARIVGGAGVARADDHRLRS